MKKNRLKNDHKPGQTETFILYAFLSPKTGRRVYEINKPDNVPENSLKIVFKGSWEDCCDMRIKVGTELKQDNPLYLTTDKEYLQTVFN